MPIRRHPALRSLSRDHHLALQLARGLQAKTDPLLRAQLPKDERALVAHVQRVFAEELAAHFDAEDGVLAPAVAGKDPALDRIMSEIESEHADMMKIVARLSQDAFDGVAIERALDCLGHVLEAHVRREEREYYPRVQEVLDEGSLHELGAALGRHLVFHDKSVRTAAASLARPEAERRVRT